MKKSHHTAIRELLRANPDGMSAAEIAATLDIEYQTARLSVRGMPDAYIDRWEDNGMNSWRAVYCVAHKPDDMPMPERRPNEYKRTPPAVESRRAETA